MNRVIFSIAAVAVVIWSLYWLGTQTDREKRAINDAFARLAAERRVEAQKQTAEAREKAKVESAKVRANAKLLLESLYGHPCMLGVTMEAYDVLGQGMNETEVRSVIGDDGIEQSTIGNVVTKCWKEGNKEIVVTFQNGRLVGKSQVRL